MELFFQIAGIALVIIGIFWGIFFCWIPLKKSIKKIQEQTQNNQKEESLSTQSGNEEEPLFSQPANEDETLSPKPSDKNEDMKIFRPLLHNLLAAILMIAGAVMVWIGATH
jgi:hypothetical protein